MFCTKCGVNLSDDAAFCYNCGASVVKNTQETNSEQEYTAESNTVNAEFVGTEASGDFIDDDVEALIGAEKQKSYMELVCFSFWTSLDDLPQNVCLRRSLLADEYTCF